VHSLPAALVPVGRPGQVLIAAARQALNPGVDFLAWCPEQLREAFPRKRRCAPHGWVSAVIHDFGRHVAWLVSAVERHEQRKRDSVTMAPSVRILTIRMRRSCHQDASALNPPGGGHDRGSLDP
jgi:hypothetical protein